MTNKLFENGKLIIFTDGGARGNPGPAAIGAIVGTKKYGEKIGKTTNNVAEYQAVIFALHKAKQLLGKKKAKETELELNTDSELVYKQIRGEYKIQEPELQKLFIEIWNVQQDFKKVYYKKVPREKNKQADAMVNLALDGKLVGEENKQSRLL